MSTRYESCYHDTSKGKFSHRIKREKRCVKSGALTQKYFLYFSYGCGGFVASKDGSKCWLVTDGCGKEGGQKDKFDFYRKRWLSKCILHIGLMTADLL